ncbi:Signal transduction histidine kinase [Natronincola ferrireducens]|uniref:histidine kinase n=2 Tax=Natronincola ferrireducens TaxID=393762 RepID=A0A1G9FR77_9FIRM|nr:Signal transduction histidine kinase [Natronincola ferrireducens]
MPRVFNSVSFPIYKYMYLSAINSDQGLLLIAAFMLIIMNSIRILPIYTATFALMEWIHKTINTSIKKFIYIFMVLMIIPSIYHLIYCIYDIRYNFGMTSILVISAMTIFSIREMKYISITKKSIFIIILLIGFQWLDIVPTLSDYGFGNGEISRDIKYISAIINTDSILTFISWFLFCIFTVNALLIYKIFVDQNKALIDIEITRKIKKELDEARLNNIKARSIEETQNLVHDLKTPLTTIQVYASLIEMTEIDVKCHDYAAKILSSVNQLNCMISEILQENKKRMVTIEELFDSILSQISTYDIADILKVNIACSADIIYMNKIRMSRAIINIIKNSIDSIDKENPMIDIQVTKNIDQINIKISDNGKGIQQEALSRIWERGFSTKNSFGIGLGFAKTVIENHNGTIAVNSTEGQKTQVLIELPCGFQKEIAES